MSSKPAPMPDDEIDYGYPPGNEHLTFEEFIQEGEDALARGEVFTTEQVVAGLDKIRAEFLKR